MVTIDAARAIGRADSLGSLEVGKQADIAIAIVDFDHPHLTPSPNPVFGLVHTAQGFEAEAGDLDQIDLDPSLPALNIDDADIMDWVKMTDDIDEACAT